MVPWDDKTTEKKDDGASLTLSTITSLLELGVAHLLIFCSRLVDGTSRVDFNWLMTS